MFENLKDDLYQIEKKLENLKDALHQIEMAEKINKPDRSMSGELESAKIMKKAYEYFSKGLNSWEVAEKIKGYFSSVWDAYYFISREKAQENARIRFAKAYLVKTLANSGFKYSEIAPIAQLSPQRCGQIDHTFKN